MTMTRVAKRIAIGIVLGVVLGFFLFLYFIPPFTLISQEEFINPYRAAGPSLEHISDPAERQIAEYGKYLVQSFDCSGCHTPAGDEGPNWDEYLAGGNRMLYKGVGAMVSRNLTPDKETGLGRRSFGEVIRILRSGVLADGRQIFHRDMPWGAVSNMTDEDKYAVVVYLRHLKPVYHLIPEPDASSIISDQAAVEAFYNKDRGGHSTK